MEWIVYTEGRNTKQKGFREVTANKDASPKDILDAYNKAGGVNNVMAYEPFPPPDYPGKGRIREGYIIDRIAALSEQKPKAQPAAPSNDGKLAPEANAGKYFDPLVAWHATLIAAGDPRGKK